MAPALAGGGCVEGAVVPLGDVTAGCAPFWSWRPVCRAAFGGNLLVFAKAQRYQPVN